MKINVSYDERIEYLANKLVNEIEDKIHEIFTDIDSSRAEHVKLPAKLDVLRLILSNTFYSPVTHKIYMINDEDSLIELDRSRSNNDAMDSILRVFGNWYDTKVFRESLLSAVDNVHRENSGRKPLMSKLLDQPFKSLFSFMVHYSQRSDVSYEIDIFAERSYIEITPDKAKVRLKHVHYPAPLPVNEIRMDIIDDYKCHFSKLDELIDWIVASRFLVDRKKAHLWLQCDSDWGKGMLFNELDKAGLLTKISVKEIEKAMSGNPVGKSARDFRRSLILWVDEFKNVKSELKEICSELTLSPKNQLSVTVPLYCKVFTSAEGVASLANDYGVEDQFANRFSYIKGENSIEVREMWQRVGSVVYGDNVISYIVHNINKKIDEMRILGRTEAALKSEKYIANYKKKYGIDKSFSRLSENIEVIASEISAYIYERLEFSKTTTWDGQQCYLSTPVRVVEDIMNELYTKSMMGTFRFKTNDIIQCLSVSGTGVKPKRLVIGGVSKTAKVLEVRRPETFNVFEEELEETIVTNLSDINTLKAA